MEFPAALKVSLTGLLLMAALPAICPIQAHAQGGCVEGVGPHNERQPCATGASVSSGDGDSPGTRLGTWLREQIGNFLFGDPNAPAAHRPSSAPLPLAMPVRSFHPAFNCNDATTAAEKRVCGSRELSELDRRLGSAYLRLLRMLDRARRIELGYEQRGWMARRDACQDDAACIANAYNRRTVEFAARAVTLERASNPTFPCSRAQTEAEKRVCASGDLAELDRQLGAGYKQLRQSLEPGQREALKTQQNVWRERRDRCGNNEVCIAVAYTQRLADFKQASSAPSRSQASPQPTPASGNQQNCPLGSCNPAPVNSGIALPPAGAPLAGAGATAPSRFAQLTNAMRDGKLADKAASDLLLDRARFYLGCTFDRTAGCDPSWQSDLPKLEGRPRGVGSLSAAQVTALTKTKDGMDLVTVELNARLSVDEARATREKTQIAYDHAQPGSEKDQLAVTLTKAKQEESNRNSELMIDIINTEKGVQLLADTPPNDANPPNASQNFPPGSPQQPR
jgi:uncharacterized protein